MPFSFSVAAIKAAYDTFLTAQAQVVSDQTSLAALIATKPVPPVYVTINTDYTAYQALLVTYNSSLLTAQTLVSTDTAIMRTAELAVITAMGYQSGGAANCNGQDEWIKVVGAGAGILTYTNYIGYSSNSTYLTVSTILPTKPFPGV